MIRRMNLAITPPSPVVFLLFALMGLYFYWIFNEPHVFRIKLSDIPNTWSIGGLLKLTAVMSVILATWHTYGVFAAVVASLTLMKVIVSSASP